MAKVNLSKGGTVNLQKEVPSLKRVRVGLGWDEPKADLDVTAFILKHDAQGNAKCEDPEYMVFYNNLVSPNKEVTHTGDNRSGKGDGDDESLLIDVASTLASSDEVSIVVTIHKSTVTFGNVKNAYVKIYNDETNDVIAEYKLTDTYTTETALQVGSIIKENNSMVFKAIGQGYNIGLAEFCQGYGLDV